MNQYIITEEQLLVMTSWATNKGVCLYEKRLSIATDVRSHPYNPQAEREKVLDEVENWVHEKTDYKAHIVNRHEILDKIKELRQGKEGEP